MLFNSAAFLVFFPVVTAGYFALPHRLRWAWLLAASCYFYMAFIPIYILILAFTIVVDYFAGILIERAAGSSRRLWLMASLIANVGVLFFFKYYNFFNESLLESGRWFGAHWQLPALNIILPIGLSFHTFQAMSYTIEVYRGNQKAERHFGVYALYVMFYPQLVAGPIERPQNVLHQFHERHAFNADDAREGLRLMLLGLVKKVVIADNIAVLVDRVYTDPHRYPAPVLALATALFAFQIYADFSGYSDIALGTARFMGIRLMTNFNHPYLARSISEFWRRWHISLSTWFRDYVYIPLGGNRKGYARTQFNLLATFSISGLWHGANWTFVIWGALNGLYLVAANVTDARRARAAEGLGLSRWPRLHALLAGLWTFVLVTIAWTFFRARTVGDAAYVLRTVATESWRYHTPGALRAALATLDMPRGEVLGAVLAAVALFAFDYAAEHHGGGAAALSRHRATVRWGLYYAGVTALLVFGRFGLQQFIYFQF